MIHAYNVPKQENTKKQSGMQLREFALFARSFVQLIKTKSSNMFLYKIVIYLSVRHLPTNCLRKRKEKKFTSNTDAENAQAFIEVCLLLDRWRGNLF